MTSNFTEQTDTLFSDREKMEMLEKWFQKRTEMTTRALKLFFMPVPGVLFAALLFWYQFYIPVHPVVLFVILGISLLVWVICLIMGGSIFRKVRTGDSIMLRRIRASSAKES